MARKAAAQLDPEAKEPSAPTSEIDKDIEIDIDERPDQEGAEVETATSATQPSQPEPSLPPQDDVVALRKRLEEMERAEQLAQRNQQAAQQQLEESQRQLSEAQRGQRQSQWQAWQDRYDSVVNTMGAAQSAIDAATQEYETAAANGDWKTASEANTRGQRASAKLERAETVKEQMDADKERWERQRQQPRQQQQSQPQRQQQQPQTTEQIIAGAAIPDRAKNWLRQHPEYVTDPVKNNQLITLNGIIAPKTGEFTDAYFEWMEELLGMRADGAESTGSKERSNGGNGAPRSSPQPQRQSAPVSAPPTREAPSMSTGRAPTSSRVSLTKEEVEVAKASKFSEDEPDSKAIERYARNKQKMLNMKKNGEIQ